MNIQKNDTVFFDGDTLTVEFISDNYITLDGVRYSRRDVEVTLVEKHHNNLPKKITPVAPTQNKKTFDYDESLVKRIATLDPEEAGMRARELNQKIFGGCKDKILSVHEIPTELTDINDF